MNGYVDAQLRPDNAHPVGPRFTTGTAARVVCSKHMVMTDPWMKVLGLGGGFKFFWDQAEPGTVIDVPQPSPPRPNRASHRGRTVPWDQCDRLRPRFGQLQPVITVYNRRDVSSLRDLLDSTETWAMSS